MILFFYVFIYFLSDVSSLSLTKFNLQKFRQRIKCLIAIPCIQLGLGGHVLTANAIEQPLDTISSTIISKTNEGNVPLYFGVGCFWHVQHEFVEAERSLLDRTDGELTVLKLKFYMHTIQNKKVMISMF